MRADGEAQSTASAAGQQPTGGRRRGAAACRIVVLTIPDAFGIMNPYKGAKNAPKRTAPT